MQPLPDPTGDALWNYVEDLKRGKPEGRSFFAQTTGDPAEFAALIPLTDVLYEAIHPEEQGLSGRERAQVRLLEELVSPPEHTTQAGGGGIARSRPFARWPLARRRWAAAALLAATTVAACWIRPVPAPLTTLRVRAMIQDHEEFVHGPSKVAFRSTQPSRVAAWLSGRLRYSVTPVDLSFAGASLVGGRRCTLEGIPIAFFMYRSANAPVSLYEFAAPRCRLPGLAPRLDNGRRFLAGMDGRYRVVAWRARRRVYVLVADLPADRLMEIALHGASSDQTDQQGDSL
ncbi:MAG: hypothetical protein LC772_09390 [Chloroflexi bacterium]|nr:hypothetical protein [Chloroflexota bacterium]